MTNPAYSTAKVFVCAEDPDGLRIKISSSVFGFLAVPLQKVSAWPQRSKQSTVGVWSVNHDTFVIWLRQYQKGHESDRSQQTAWKTERLQPTHIPRGHYEQLRSTPRHQIKNNKVFNVINQLMNKRLTRSDAPEIYTNKTSNEYATESKSILVCTLEANGNILQSHKPKFWTDNELGVTKGLDRNIDIMITLES